MTQNSKHPSEEFSHRDRAVVFGEYQNLVGVVREGASQKTRTAVIILTPGMLHSAGPFRLHHDIAKTLGESEILSLRFDLSGIGESLGVGSDKDSLDRAASEIAEAIDFLTLEYGVESVLLFGLCSGADDAIHAALNDERIVGVFAMDGCGYRTSKYYWHLVADKYLPKLLNPSKWRRHLAASFGVARSTPASLQLGEDIREFPNRSDAEEQILALTKRSVGLHFHYTGGVSEYYNYQNQFTDMFPRIAELVEENAQRGSEGCEGTSSVPSWSFNADSDHVAFLADHRRDLVDVVCRKLHEFIASLPSSMTINDEVDSEPSQTQETRTVIPAFPAAPISTPHVDV